MVCQVYYCLKLTDNTVVGHDYWLMVDESQTGLEKLYTTPEEALKAFEERIN